MPIFSGLSPGEGRRTNQQSAIQGSWKLHFFNEEEISLLQKSNLKQQQQPVTLAAQPEPPAPMKKPAQVADMSKFLFDDGEQPHRLQSGPLYIKVEI